MHKSIHRTYGTDLAVHQMVGGPKSHDTRHREPMNTAHTGYKPDYCNHAEPVHVSVKYNVSTNKIG